MNRASCHLPLLRRLSKTLLVVSLLTQSGLESWATTAEMRELISESTAGLTERIPSLKGNRLERLKKKAARSATPEQRRRIEFKIAETKLYYGQSAEAIEALHALAADLEESAGPAQFRVQVEELLAVAHLRAGEEANCIALHGEGSCIVPIRESGQHVDRAGSTAAREIYGRLLQNDPDRLINRWLYNVASMTLGEFPGGVPEAWRLPADGLDSDYDMGRFPDVAPSAGVGVFTLAGSVAVDDFTNDNLLDLFVCTSIVDGPLHFFINNGDGTFTDATDKAGLSGRLGGLNLVHADYNNDGWLDVYVCRGAWFGRNGQIPDSLFRNNGDGTFDDVTLESGLLFKAPVLSAAWGDYDNDGWLDLFVGGESRDDQVYPCRLYRNRGDGTFQDVASDSGVAVQGHVKGVVWGDVNNDGLLDLYISRFHEPNHLFMNQGQDAAGQWRFRDQAEASGVVGPIDSFPVWFWDYDNDGHLDLTALVYPGTYDLSLQRVDFDDDYVAEYFHHPNRSSFQQFFRNDGQGQFIDMSETLIGTRPYFAMGANYGDLDNDGWLDLSIGTGSQDFRHVIPNRAFRNMQGKRFQDVTTSGGFGHIQKGHGIGFGDLNNDGDQEMYHAMGGALPGDKYQNTLYDNPGNSNRWITLKLEGVTSNRSAIGARIQVTTDNADGPQHIHRVISSGGSFGASSLQAEIGLGMATDIQQVQVQWPTSGTTQVFTNLTMNAVYHIKEGAEQAEKLAVKSFQFGRGSAAAHHHDHHGH